MYHLKRADAQAHSGTTKREREHFEPHYPLIEWGYNLEKCKRIWTPNLARRRRALATEKPEAP
jgi:hypothetical protein